MDLELGKTTSPSPSPEGVKGGPEVGPTPEVSPARGEAPAIARSQPPVPSPAGWAGTLPAAFLESERSAGARVAFVSADWEKHPHVRVNSASSLVRSLKELSSIPELPVGAAAFGVRDDGTVFHAATGRAAYQRVGAEGGHPPRLQEAVDRHFAGAATAAPPDALKEPLRDRIPSLDQVRASQLAQAASHRALVFGPGGGVTVPIDDPTGRLTFQSMADEMGPEWIPILERMKAAGKVVPVPEDIRSRLAGQEPAPAGERWAPLRIRFLDRDETATRFLDPQLGTYRVQTAEDAGITLPSPTDSDVIAVSRSWMPRDMVLSLLHEFVGHHEMPSTIDVSDPKRVVGPFEVPVSALLGDDGQLHSQWREIYAHVVQEKYALQRDWEPSEPDPQGWSPTHKEGRPVNTTSLLPGQQSFRRAGEGGMEVDVAAIRAFVESNYGEQRAASDGPGPELETLRVTSSQPVELTPEMLQMMIDRIKARTPAGER